MELLLNDNLKRIMTLLDVAGNIKGRTKFQKVVYILKMKNMPFNEKFKYHYYGPFSSDLQLEIDELVDRNILVEKNMNPYDYEINKEKKITFDKDFNIANNKELIQFLNNKDSKELEITSTIFYLENNGVKNENILRKKITALKPHLKDYIDASFKLKNEINMM